MSRMEQVHADVWFVKAIFHLGEGQSEGLRYEGLKERVLSCLGDCPFENQVLNPHDKQESTAAELEEERQAITRMIDGEYVPFPLDSTMTVVRRKPLVPEGPAQISLISPVICDEEVLRQIEALGQVDTIVLPNLQVSVLIWSSSERDCVGLCQHWIFAEPMALKFPDAKLLLAPAACDEDLADKLPQFSDRFNVLEDGFQLGEELEARLLQGAPLNMNEYVFYHGASRTLIASDAFYGGHTQAETSWFERLWFKLTKQGSFRACRMPVYRTVRVKTHGSVKDLLKCVDGMVEDWHFDRILFAHGTNPFEKDARAAFSAVWHNLESDDSANSKVDHSIKGTGCRN